MRRERTGRPGAAVRARVSFVEGEETRKGTDWVATEEPLEDRLPLRDHLVLVSGRASFELAQKSVTAGVPILCSVSAPSSLAIEVASEST